MNDFQFPANAPAANPVFFRTYSQRKDYGKGRRESFQEVMDRNIKGFESLGKLTPKEVDLLREEMQSLHFLPSGRWLWVGGTDHVKKQDAFYSAYNCSYNEIYDWRSFGLQMELGMNGCGTGASLEDRCIEKLPVIRNRLNVTVIGEFGQIPAFARREDTLIERDDNTVSMVVGDSRGGWVKSFEGLLELTSDESFDKDIDLTVDVSHIRPKGTPLKGFGGVANPHLLDKLYSDLARITNNAIGRKLTAEECCLLIDTAAKVVVAGSIRRFAGIKLFDADAPLLKLGLWKEIDGKFQIDPERDALRMSNHTRVYRKKPTLEEVVEAVQLQYESGEGAILWAGEEIARANADVLNTPERKKSFLEVFDDDETAASHLLKEFASMDGITISADELDHRMNRTGLNPCGEIIGGAGFMCNLAEVNCNKLEPKNYEQQEKAFKAAALSVAILLRHKFKDERVQKAREYDPIVAVCPTGIFDFFVTAFGVDWLKWWQAGRPAEWGKVPVTSTPIGTKFSQSTVQEFDYLSDYYTTKEQEYFSMWRKWVFDTVWDYCDRHGLKRPNRCTAVQPSGSKALLTNASPGWHPPKSQRFIRRITFRKDDPVALACIDYGYNVVPSQSDKDENGVLLDDPFDPRVTEWLCEMPVEVPWADIPGVDEIDISNFSAIAQFSFLMQVQKYYTTHNTSSTVLLSADEVESLSEAIYTAIQNDEGYISAALLAKFNAPYPRLPFEAISKEQYKKMCDEVLSRRKTNDFHAALNKYDVGKKALEAEMAPNMCDKDGFCEMPK